MQSTACEGISGYNFLYIDDVSIVEVGTQLTIAKTVNVPANVKLGDNISYTITVTNNSVVPAIHPISIFDMFPYTQLTYVSSPDFSVWPGHTIPSLGVGESVALTVNAQVATDFLPFINNSTVTNCVQIISNGICITNTNEACASFDVKLVNLSVSKTIESMSNGAVDYKITVTNDGTTNNAATNVMILY